MAIRPASEICVEVQDHSATRHSAIELFQLKGFRDPGAQAARIARQFEAQNRSLLSLLDVGIQSEFDGNDVHLVIRSGSAVGAVPLVSPTTAQYDYGLVVQPRFPWSGIGPMLAEMGWRVTPIPLKLPLLRRSERRVPVWVLSLMILTRLRALLDSLDRRFELVAETRSSPRGSVHWGHYSARSIPTGNFLSIPCTFPDIRDDRLLKGAVRYSAELQLRALETQKEQGAFVNRLMGFAEEILQKVRLVPAYRPSTTVLGLWARRPLKTGHFTDGLQAIEWTVDERGLAGSSDLEGIPWMMPMDKFFEAWVESVLSRVAQSTGAHLKSGRKHETNHPIQWETPYLGSQKSLVPDLWLEWGGKTLVVDAKYKRHWEELHSQGWTRFEDELREQHRSDLLQVLAYANLARTPEVIACLAYPCARETWIAMRDRGRLFQKASIAAGNRSVQLWLTAVPMSSNIEELTIPFVEHIRDALRENPR